LRDAVTGTPGFRSRRADTAVEMKAGQTLAIAGLVYQRTEASNRGTPWLADLPWAGAAFRRTSERVNEVELLIFVTPEFCEALDPHEVPPCGPGELTTSPTDTELYWRGYLEVPKANCPNGQCAPGGDLYGPGAEVLPPPKGSPAGPPSPVVDPSARRRSTTPGKGYAGDTRGPAPTGTTATYRPASTGGASAAPQNGYSSYYSSGQPQKPSATAQPTLIGPLGYDDLK
jgi:pilus assembly protein CpaC